MPLTRRSSGLCQRPCKEKYGERQLPLTTLLGEIVRPTERKRPAERGRLDKSKM